MESFLNRYRNITVLLLAIFAQLVLLAVQVKNDRDVRIIRVWTVTAVTPVARVVEALRGGGAGFFHNYVLVRDAREENRRLRAELDKLKLENIFLKNDLNTAERAKALEIFRSQTPSKTVAATVIGVGAGSNSKVLIVDRGTVSGVMRGMPVVTPDGIVGKVIAAYPTASQILLISDPEFAAGVVSAKGQARGTLKGQGTPLCKVDYVPFEDKVEPGDWFYTSGDDRIFPRGFPVGVVKAVRSAQPFKEILVEPSGLKRGLEDVLILIGGVHQEIPDGPPSSQPVYVAPPPPPPVGTGLEGAPAQTQPGLRAEPPGTEADRLRSQYKAIGEAQGHTFGEGLPGSRPPDFNKGPLAPPVPVAPAPGGLRAKAPRGCRPRRRRSSGTRRGECTVGSRGTGPGPRRRGGAARAGGRSSGTRRGECTVGSRGTGPGPRRRDRDARAGGRDARPRHRGSDARAGGRDARTRHRGGAARAGGRDARPRRRERAARAGGRDAGPRRRDRDARAGGRDARPRHRGSDARAGGRDAGPRRRGSDARAGGRDARTRRRERAARAGGRDARPRHRGSDARAGGRSPGERDCGAAEATSPAPRQPGGRRQARRRSAPMSYSGGRILLSSQREGQVSRFRAWVLLAVPLAAILFQVYVPLFFQFLGFLEMPLLVVVYFALMRRSPVSGVFVGALVGLAQDSLSKNPLGMFGIVKTLVGYFAASVGVRLDVDQGLIRLVLAFFFYLFHQFFYWVMSRAMLGQPVGLEVKRTLVLALLNAVVGVSLFHFLDRLRETS